MRQLKLRRYVASYTVRRMKPRVFANQHGSEMRSMSEKRLLCLAMMVVAMLISAHATHAAALDVLHYSSTLEPDIAGKSVKGTVRIRFLTDSHEAEFNCGDLAIDSVRLGNAALKFSITDHR